MKVSTHIEPSKDYRVIQLLPEIREALKDANQEIYIKASGPQSQLVLCTNTRTFRLRQKNHSNTVLVMKGKTDALMGFTSLHSELEPTPVRGNIDTSGVPVFKNAHTFTPGKSAPSINDVLMQSPISPLEFKKQWGEMSGCEIAGEAVLLHRETITRILDLILSTVIAEGESFENLIVGEVYKNIKSVDETITFEMVETVIFKFSDPLIEPFHIDSLKVSKWYGIHALSTFAKNPLSSDEFMIRWKSVIPGFFDCSIELSLLLGFFYRPLNGKVQYLQKGNLPSNPRERFDQLFQLQSTWELEEIEPFISDLNTKNLKLESFIMKYAKRRKAAKKVLVSAR